MNDGIYTIPPCGTENLVAVCKELRSFGSLIELFFLKGALITALKRITIITIGRY